MERANAIPFAHTDTENSVAATVGTVVELASLLYVLVWIGRWVRTGFKQERIPALTSPFVI